jgi:hypothetical protein
MNGFPRRLLLILLVMVLLSAARLVAVSAADPVPPSPEPGTQSDDPAVLKQELEKARAVIREQEAALIALRKDYEALKKRYIQVAENLSRARSLVRPHLPDDPSLDHPERPQLVDARVLAVSGGGNNGMVEVSLGTKNGVAIGQRLEVFRLDGPNSAYLGQVEVVSIQPDRSVAKVVRLKGPIKKGDRVVPPLAP